MDEPAACQGALIPTFNELANGSPFTLTPLPHTFTHQTLLVYPLGHTKEDRMASLNINPIAWPHARHVEEAQSHFLYLPRRSQAFSEAVVDLSIYSSQKFDGFVGHYIFIKLFHHVLFVQGRLTEQPCSASAVPFITLKLLDTWTPCLKQFIQTLKRLLI